MQTTQELIKGLSNSEVVGATNELFNTVFTQVRYDDMVRNAEGVAEMDSLVSLDMESLEHKMSDSESAHLGRLVLQEYASDTELEPLVRQAVEKVRKSDDLFVGALLAVGVVVNLTMLLATTELTVEKDANGNITWKLEKKKPSPELAEAIINPLLNITSTLLGLG